ncbi:hypothetical protein [Halomonas llamarensis]|uniref:Uncharacterized protein n=1 Tax=Halomonas llamarensis TaxID=2945104 RepID=A0ABT0SRK5_9GAMM|nr:hypothetical protein [Halomonas llamarensis]MCL7930460.1 hypothetical protein [Halomonas llamarensis]
MGTVTPIRQAKFCPLDSENVAIARLWNHRDWPRHEALDDCIDYLCDAHDMPRHRAENAAFQALAEMESVNARGTIDIASTTSHAVVITNRAGQRIALTVRDLRRLLDGQDLQCGNSVTGKLLMLEH